jgi:glycosyltransferase involved in cell wall biosynthesis
MHVLLATEYFPRLDSAMVFSGGIESRTYQVARYLAQTDQVTVAAARLPGQPSDETAGQLRVIRCGPERPYAQGGQLLNRLRLVQSIYRLGVELCPDIVESSVLTTHYAASQIGRTLGIPAVAFYPDVWIGKWISIMGVLSGVAGEVLERRVLRAPWSRYIVLTTATRDALRNLGVSPELIEVIPCGVDVDRIRRIEAQSFWPDPLKSVQPLC